MTFWVGLILIAVTVAMIVAARPRNGEPAPFLTWWVAGQAYILTALTSAVMGVSFAITSLPF